MPTCTRNGCKKEFSPDHNLDGACTYHPGGPVFHEGLKSWSCCSGVNRPELEFDAFMRIPGCETGLHTTEAIKIDKPQPSSRSDLHMTNEVGGKESYIFAGSTIVPRGIRSEQKPRAVSLSSPAVEEEDDSNAPVAPGTKCQRKGCGAEFTSNEESRQGDGVGAVCTYHSGLPIFHEGSKGYLCCKRRVLEFDEFLKIAGCKKGRHLFVPQKAHETEEVVTNCRIDHYQTPATVHVTIFAKKVDPARSTVKFEETRIYLNLHLPESKCFRRSLDLYGPIDPFQSNFTFLGTKVELVLKKQDKRSWNLLEQPARDVGTSNLTFGVGGRTGTVGSRQPVLDEVNKMRS